MQERVSIVLLTAARPKARAKYALKTLKSVLEKVHYSGPLAVHIADDGSFEGHVDKLMELAREAGYKRSASDSLGRGYGANYNLATQMVHDSADVVMPIEDDWELLRPLDLDPLVEALRGPEIGCIRLGYLGFTQAVLGSLSIVAGQTFMLFDPDSPEPHIFAGHPRIETVAFERSVGPWPEWIDGRMPTPGETEFAVSHIPAARVGVAWPLDLVKPAGDLFAHIGSEQSEGRA